jgi:4'-phosphopantetheinyl transferase
MKPSEPLKPVLLSVPAEIDAWPPPAKVKYLSRHARRALDISARKSAVRLGELTKDPSGRPLPSEGMHWSLSHKPRYVGAVVADSPVGIDLEPLKARKNKALLDKIADPKEWRLVADKSWHFFYRFWTAKEAVLKAGGTGLKDLSKCRIQSVEHDLRLIARYRGREWPVEHFFFDGHIASVIIPADRDVDWTVIQHSFLDSNELGIMA